MGKGVSDLHFSEFFTKVFPRAAGPQPTGVAGMR